MVSDSALQQARARDCAPGVKVLVVDDERSIRRPICAWLTARGYAAFEAGTGSEVLEAVRQGVPSDVIVLDLCLPDLDGIEVTRRLRRFTHTPIIVLSVRSSEADKIAALDAGADEYMTKPCAPARLLERIHAAMLRTTLDDSRFFESGSLKVDLDHNLVYVGGERVELTPREYELLRVLVVNVGKLLTQQLLIQEVWGETPSEEALPHLRAAISSLRRKLEIDPTQPSCIGTEPGVGYRLWTKP
jgi:two-component system, OmpR family, KDP operon response regulator KdpE